MTTIYRVKIGISIAISLYSLSALAFDPLKLHCVRQDREGEQIFLSEIHFRKAGRSAIANKYEGEVVSYSLKGTVKKYISGFNLFAVAYHDETISGLTGDPITHADGSFSLSKLSARNSGLWKFAYTDTSGHCIDAEFKCIYGDRD